MAKTPTAKSVVLDDNLRTLLEGMREVIDGILGGSPNGNANLSPEDVFRAELKDKTITELRTIAVDDWNFVAKEVRGVSKDVLIDNLVSAKFEDTEPDEEDEATEDVEDEELELEDDDAEEVEEEDEDDEVTVSRSDLEGMNLRALRKFARENAGLKPADYKDLDTDELIDLILGQSEEAEDEEADEEDDELEIDEDEESEDDADEDSEDEGEFYTEDELKKMKLAELRDLAKESGIRLTKVEATGKTAAVKASIIKKLLA